MIFAYIAIYVYFNGQTISSVFEQFSFTKNANIDLFIIKMVLRVAFLYKIDV